MIDSVRGLQSLPHPTFGKGPSDLEWLYSTGA